MLKKGYVEIQSDNLLYWYSKLTGTKGDAKAAAFYPFLITTSKIHSKMRSYFINHECIHFAQQKEMLIVGAWILHLVEWIKYRIIKKQSAFETYLLYSVEQEAYDNMFDLEYLKKRKTYAHIHQYWKNKPLVWKEYLKKKEGIEGTILVK